MESLDLSVPFRRAAAKVVNVGGSVGARVAEQTGGSVSNVVSDLNSKYRWKLWIAAGVLLFALYYFFIAQSKTDPNKVQLPRAPQTPAPNSLEMADQAFERYDNTTDPYDMAQHYQFAIDNYMDAMNTTQDPQVLGHIFHRLAILFHQGVPEGDAGGGVPPDAQQAIQFYREAIKMGYHGSVMPLASIYHWGLTGFEGNREVAKHLYGVVLKVGTEYEKGQAKDRLRQMREEDGHAVSNGMLEEEASVSAGNFSTSGFGSNAFAEHFMDFNKSPYEIGRDETTKGMDEKYVDDLIENKLSIRGRRTDSRPKVVTRDPQNARDHVVVNSAKQSLERLRANTHIQYDVPTTFKMIHEYIVKKSDATQTKRERAAQVLRELSKGIANLGYEQAKEIEALQLVWNRINSQVYSQQSDKRHALMENLVTELSECIEYGELVCPTGRLNRIIDTLNHQDPIVNIQPKWAIQKTMVARAGAIEKAMLSKSRAEVREAMRAVNPTARQRQLQTEFMQKVRSAIERDLTRRYVDTGLMTKALLKTELDSWMLT
jgi:uncharacterized protein YukE